MARYWDAGRVPTLSFVLRTYVSMILSITFVSASLIEENSMGEDSTILSSIVRDFLILSSSSGDQVIWGSCVLSIVTVVVSMTGADGSSSSSSSIVTVVPVGTSFTVGKSSLLGRSKTLLSSPAKVASDCSIL